MLTDTKMDFCKEFSVLVVGKVFGLTGASAKIIKENFIKYGGKAELYDEREGVNLKGLTHILVPKRMSSDYLGKIKRSAGCKVVCEEWAYQMFIRKEALAPEEYLWKEPDAVDMKRKSLVVDLPVKKVKVEHVQEPGRNFNYHLTKELDKLKGYYEILGDKGRTITYSNIIRTLRLLPFQVDSVQQISNIEGFGDKSLRKIKEILEKGSLQRLDTFRQNERVKTIELLKEVHGIGNELAFVLYKKGIKTFKALQDFEAESPEFFTEAQKIGIKLHTELKQKLPREEALEISLILKAHTQMIDPCAKFELCGSYRRGRALCGDIDIVIGSKIPTLLASLLSACPIITHTLSFSSHKFLGVCKLHTLHRRIDIYACKPSEFFFATLYFTGSSNYNRLLRLSASKKGLHLSNTSLFNAASGQPALVPESEQEIISFLGFPEISFEERDI